MFSLFPLYVSNLSFIFLMPVPLGQNTRNVFYTVIKIRTNFNQFNKCNVKKNLHLFYMFQTMIGVEMAKLEGQ